MKACFIVLFVTVQLVVCSFSGSRKRREENQSNVTTNRQKCNTDQIEYRLTKLEVQTAEKGENVRSELREVTRRLQMLEWQNTETTSALESVRAELSRFVEHGPQKLTGPSTSPDTENLGNRVESLVKGVKLLVAAMRTVSSDILYAKNNISAIANKTNTLLENNEHLVTKEFLNNGLTEIKFNQIFSPRPHPPPNHDGCQKQQNELATSCKELKQQGQNASGIYRIQPEHSHNAFMVFCDMQTNGGGWTYIHNRFDGTQDFYLNWHDYKQGFGNLGEEFWLGLNHIHDITGYEINELLVELVDMDMKQTHAHYQAFSVGPEQEGFPIKVLGGYSGDAGDSLMYHAGSRFSTKDMDQDGWAEGSCAQSHGGAWWYRGCDTSNLNGKYMTGELPEQYIYQGMYWGEFRGPKYSLMQARMLVRPRDKQSPVILPITSNSKDKPRIRWVDNDEEA